MMRNAFLLSIVLIAASCASSDQSAKPQAHIPAPDITIAGRTDMSDLPGVAAGIVAHLDFRIQNNADVPITLKHIDLTGQAGIGIRIESKNRPFDVVIAPHSVQSVAFLTNAFITDPMAGAGKREPVNVRVVAYFDSPEGSLQKVFQQPVRIDSAE
jgi:hypothetical protein